MALTGVLRPGHAQIRVTELGPAIHFYRDVLGLVETGRDSVSVSPTGTHQIRP